MCDTPASTYISLLAARRQVHLELERHIDPASGAAYLFNPKTGESTWCEAGEDILTPTAGNVVEPKSHMYSPRTLTKMSSGLNKDYGVAVSMHAMTSKFHTRQVYLSESKRPPKCVLCKKRTPSSVFFPCAHSCVCDVCAKEKRVGPSSAGSAGMWEACPVCMSMIKKVLPLEGGREEDRYWDWVHEVKPPLPRGFARKLAKCDPSNPKSFRVNEGDRIGVSEGGCCIIM